VPAGFPPLPVYRLDHVDETAADAGLPTVVRRRTTLSGNDLIALWFVGSVDAGTAYRAWLTAAGGAMTRAACAGVREHEVLWSNAAALRRLVATDQSVVEREFAAMVRELRCRGALLASDAKTAKPNIRVLLHDERGDTRQPLPQPESLLAPPKSPPRATLR